VSDSRLMMTESELREKWIMCCNSLRLQTERVDSLTAERDELREALRNIYGIAGLLQASSFTAIKLEGIDDIRDKSKQALTKGNDNE